MMFNKWKTLEGWRHSSKGLSDWTLHTVLDEYPKDPAQVENPTFAAIFYKCRSMLDASYRVAFSRSTNLHNLLISIPGFLVQGLRLSILVDADLARDLIGTNRPFISGNFDPTNGPEKVILNRHVADFLLDQERSREHYHNPTPHHIHICRRYFSRLCEAHWSVYASNSNEVFRDYMFSMISEHLYAANIDPSDEILEGHPMREFLDYLQRIVFYHHDLQNASYRNIAYIWFAALAALKWVQRQQTLPNNSDCAGSFRIKLSQIIDRIYGQILCSEISGNEKIVKVCPLFLAAMKHHIREERMPSGSNPVFQLPAQITNEIATTLTEEYSTRISDDFLLLDEINPSLTECLTDPGRAGTLYISAGVYHTQLAEYWLETCECPSFSLSKDKDAIQRKKEESPGVHWKVHLVQALPSERIFARLRVIYSWSLIGASRPHHESFRAIIRWLESLPKPPLDIYLRWQMELLVKEEKEEAENKMEAVKELGPSEILALEMPSALHPLQIRSTIMSVICPWLVYALAKLVIFLFTMELTQKLMQTLLRCL
ncbi:hypothetical protein B0H34DRAFT_1156 [Crassisporium funariophilum]|nr:hypothetical protein B0H34DRAFT_1156 [Crassisporium funariophilum]